MRGNISRFLIKRVAFVFVIFIGVTAVTFTLTHLVPSDPAAMWAGGHARPEQVEKAREELGLDEPLPVQYYMYMEDLVHGDLGTSIRTHRPILKDLVHRIPASLELISVSMIVAVILGSLLGIWSATNRGSLIALVGRTISIAGVSLPAFYLALVLQLIFVAWLGVLPVGSRIGDISTSLQSVTGFYLIDSLITGNLEAFKSTIVHLILPAATLAAYPTGLVSRLVRSKMIESLQQPYVKTAKAAGVSKFRIVYIYTFKNTLNPIMAVIGLTIAYLLVGTFFVEIIFHYPGIGMYSTQAVLSNDFPAIMGVVLIMAVGYTVINLVVDVIQSIVDPRVVLE